MKHLLTGILGAATILLGVGPAAQAAPGDPRINIDGQSCAAARQIVAQNGAAILRYSSPQSDRILYDRFVANSRFCPVSERAERETIFRREGACALLTCKVVDFDCRFTGRLFCDD